MNAYHALLAEVQRPSEPALDARMPRRLDAFPLPADLRPMTTFELCLWVLSALTEHVPPERVSPRFPQAVETLEEKHDRYVDIAWDIASVSSNKRDAALLVAVAIKESGLARDVDLGPCDPARVRLGQCDAGRAKTLWQLQAVDGWPDRREAARMALKRLRHSEKRCRDLPAEERLAAYAAGTCTSSAGRKISRDRVEFARRIESR